MALQVRPTSRRPKESLPSDEARRLSLFQLFGLAAGGTIGSGWLLGAADAYDKAGVDAPWAWLIGGLVMLVVAGVMVELGTAAPKTGGLIFLPLQSSGPLVAIVAAAGLWIFYAINAASESVAMTKGLSSILPTFLIGPHTTLTAWGWVCSLALMAVISATNLLVPRLVRIGNSWLTLVKVVVPLLTIVLFILSGFDHQHGGGGEAGDGAGGAGGFGAVLAAVVDSGVIYAYVGFQGPLDFAGNVKAEGRLTESARLRWAVYGTIIGTTVLYILLQVVFSSRQGQWHPGRPDSPYTQFAFASSMAWLGWCLRINSVLSPMGAGLVFTHALTREVATLSRAHLTHRGLQTMRTTTLRGRDVYWLVLAVDFVVGVVVLLAMGGRWHTLVAADGVLTLVVYAVPGVALVSLRDKLPPVSPSRDRVRRHAACVSFVLIALILYGAGWTDLWHGMAVLAVGCVLLLGLPVLARQFPTLGRFYDAREHVTRFRRLGSDPAAQAGAYLLGMLALLLVCTLFGNPEPGAPHHHAFYLWGGGVGVMALAVFRGMVWASKRHIGRVEPLLPPPTSMLRERGQGRSREPRQRTGG
ncbi:APC family permease [Streptomyces sp. NPDC048362]|uniref:APC family permease n=1 Tax=Streptomyces sp. NPDC048362 TaxID=3365539 RepID=UPI0037136E37